MDDSIGEKLLLDIYEGKIKPTRFTAVSSNVKTQKTATFLGGQPGSGKSYLNLIAIGEMALKEAVVIDSDMLRDYHPRKPMIAEKDVYSLDKDCYKWGDMLIADCVKENKNILFDGTFGGSTEQLHKKMKELKDQGYDIRVAVLAVDNTVSRIGIQYRYERQVRDHGSGRPVDSSYHAQVYAKIPANLADTASKKLVDEFTVYGRNHYTRTLAKVATISGPEAALQPTKVGEAVEKERSRPYNEREKFSLKSWLLATLQVTRENKNDPKEFIADIKATKTTLVEGLQKQEEKQVVPQKNGPKL